MITASVLSLCTFGATHLAYVLTAPSHEGVGNKEPIAFVHTVHDEVSRRPVTRMIWQLLEVGHPVYPGEAVRTSSQGEVSLEFVDSKRRLDLEPDTLIVLSQSQDEISMELLDGGAFVAKSGDEDSSGPKLTLQSASGKVDLSRATAAVRKSEGENVDLKVLEGQATMGSQEVESSGDLSELKLLSPSFDQEIFVSEHQPQPVVFNWEGLPTGARVELQSGPRRKRLRVLTRLDGTQGLWRQSLPPGRHYWKLVVKGADGRLLGESPLLKFEVKKLLAPAVIAPADRATVVIRSLKDPITFRWSPPPEATEQAIEISRDPQLRQKDMDHLPESEGSFEKVLAPGVYYWRVTAHYGEDKPSSSSAVRAFQVQHVPPKPVHLAWDSTASHKQHFVGEPRLRLKWTADEPGEVTSYRIHFNAADGSEKDFVESYDPGSEVKVPAAGRYIASIEAINEKGEVISKSKPEEIDLSALPLLPAPRFEPAGDLHANVKGDLTLKWTPLPGAKNYFITLKDGDGKDLQSRSYVHSTARLNSLMPGTYQVEIYAIDEHGRKSNLEPPRKLVVPETSGLSAPKLKKVKVN